MSDACSLEELLARRYVFHCLQAGVRIADADRARLDVVVKNLPIPPHPTVPHASPESLSELFSLTNGAVFFCPEGTKLDSIGGNYGLVLFGPDDLDAENERLKSWLLDDLDTLVDELDAVALDTARSRISSLTVIGKFCSGDPVVVDPSLASDSVEFPVVVFDFEVLLANVLDNEPAPIVGGNVVEFLRAVHADPTSYLGSWRVKDSEGRQYFVASVDCY